MFFIIVSIILAILSFLAGWDTRKAKLNHLLKFKIRVAFISFGIGMLLNLIGNNLIGDVGLILVVLSAIYLIITWIKLRDKMFAL